MLPGGARGQDAQAPAEEEHRHGIDDSERLTLKIHVVAVLRQAGFKVAKTTLAVSILGIS